MPSDSDSVPELACASSESEGEGPAGELRSSAEEDDSSCDGSEEEKEDGGSRPGAGETPLPQFSGLMGFRGVPIDICLVEPVSQPRDKIGRRHF